jgi:hypothetical protein
MTMPDKNERLSYEELVSILQKSVVAENRGGSRDFSKDDLVQAARELGIDPTVAEGLMGAHVARRGSVELAPRPFDSRIELVSQPGAFVLKVPALPLRAGHLTSLGFAAIWLAFIAFWTKGALRGGGMFAAFSIPFWAAGVGMVWRFLMPLVQRMELELGREHGSLRVSPLGKTCSFRTAEVRTRIGDHVRYRYEGASVEKKAGKALLIEHGTETIALLDGYSEQEQRWVESELRAWLSSP